jgi:hypothetical protein
MWVGTLYSWSLCGNCFFFCGKELYEITQWRLALGRHTLWINLDEYVCSFWSLICKSMALDHGPWCFIYIISKHRHWPWLWPSFDPHTTCHRHWPWLQTCSDSCTTPQRYGHDSHNTHLRQWPCLLYHMSEALALAHVTHVRGTGLTAILALTPIPHVTGTGPAFHTTHQKHWPQLPYHMSEALMLLPCWPCFPYWSWLLYLTSEALALTPI